MLLGLTLTHNDGCMEVTQIQVKFTFIESILSVKDANKLINFQFTVL